MTFVWFAPLQSIPPISYTPWTVRGYQQCLPVRTAAWGGPACAVCIHRFKHGIGNTTGDPQMARITACDEYVNPVHCNNPVEQEGCQVPLPPEVQENGPGRRSSTEIPSASRAAQSQEGHRARKKACLPVASLRSPLPSQPYMHVVTCFLYVTLHCTVRIPNLCEWRV